MKRLPPSERTRKMIEKLLTEGSEGDSPTSELMKLAMRRLVEEALEAEARDRLGRGYYERRGDGDQGYRNGYRQGRVQSAEGEVQFAVPQVRDVPGGFTSAIRQRLSGRTEELERLAVEMYARGLSTRDIEAAFRDEEGRPLLSRTAVSEVTEVLWKEYEEFANRDLSELRPLYLFVDGIAERLRPGAQREAVLAAWAITWEGRKVLLGLAPGTKESTDCCREFFQDLKRRGMPDPLFVASDGAPGLIGGIELCYPSSLRQRCLAHKVRNIVAKLPEEAVDEFKQAALASYQAPSVAVARTLREDLVARFSREYPTAVACFQDDFEACIAHLRLPPAHRRITRTTNMLERLFGEERRRLDAARTMFGERAVLKLMYSALIRAADTWRGVTITELERAQLKRLEEQLREEFERRNAPAIRPKKIEENAPSRVSSKQRT